MSDFLHDLMGNSNPCVKNRPHIKTRLTSLKKNIKSGSYIFKKNLQISQIALFLENLLASNSNWFILHKTLVLVFFYLNFFHLTCPERCIPCSLYIFLCIYSCFHLPHSDSLFNLNFVWMEVNNSG